MKIGYLTLWTRDSGGGLSLAYWHSWHSLTWRWALSWHRFRADEGRVWPLAGWRRHNAGSQAFVRVPWLGMVRLSTQPPMWYRDIWRQDCERHLVELKAKFSAGRWKGWQEGLRCQGVTWQ